MVLLIDIVLMGFQSPSANSALPQTLPLGSLGSVPWLVISASVLLKVLVEPLGEEPYQAPDSERFLALAIVPEVGVCRGEGSLDRAVSGWSFL